MLVKLDLAKADMQTAQRSCPTAIQVSARSSAGIVGRAARPAVIVRRDMALLRTHISPKLPCEARNAASPAGLRSGHRTVAWTGKRGELTAPRRRLARYRTTI